MGESFVSRKDRIIASAIEIISESGLSSLSPKTLALKENMSESLLYRYFGGIDEVLTEVVEYYAKFDVGIRQTVKARSESVIDRLYGYLDAYTTYYESYFAISTLMLQYEELLHLVVTREKIAEIIVERTRFLEDLFAEGIENGEIGDLFTPEELVNSLHGVLASYTLSRRISNRKKSFKQEFMDYIDKWILSIKNSKKEN